MRIPIVCFMILASLPASSSGVRADEFDPLLAIGEARPYRERWQACAAEAVERELQGQRPVKAVVDDALESCRDRESALARLLRRRMDARSVRRIVGELRDYDRLVLTRILERLRSK
jgi:hypothetical protein